MITTNTNGSAISAGFISQIQSDLPNMVARLWYNNAELSCDIVGITVEKGSCGQQTFMVGDVIGDILTATVKNLSTDIKDQLIECHIGALVSGSYEYISLGVFRVSEVKKTRYESKITAYSGVVADTVARFDPTGLNNPTIAQIASRVAGALNRIITFDNGIDTSLTVGAQLEGLTNYQALQVLAICAGGYVTNTNDGNIKVRQFNTTPTLTVDTGMMINLPEIAEKPYEVDSVGVMVAEATTDNEGNPVDEIFYSDNPSYIIVTKQGTDYYLQDHNGNYILANVKPETADVYFSCPYMTESIFATNVKTIKGYTYSPATVGLTLGDPRLEGCDVLTVTDVDGNTYTVPCHKIIHKYTGGFTSDITSCEASDSANNIGTSFPITQRLETQSRQIGTAQATAENAYKIAGDTNQYFWFAGSGSDTGAHITETPQEQFLLDPANGGGNLLARSNGIAVRDGLTELAIFSAEELRVGTPDANHASINSDSLTLYDDTGTKYFEASADGITFGTDSVASTGYVDQAEADAISTASADATSKATTAEANAKKEATNYLYYNASTGLDIASANPSTATRKVNISSNGVKVQEDANNYTNTTSTGFEVYQGGASVAKLGSTARVGQITNGYSRTELTAGGMQVYRRVNGADTELANIGYGNGNAQSGTADAPYFTLGYRASGGAVGNYSLAEGSNTTASGYASHAEGGSTVASNASTHAEGYGTTAGGIASHAEGNSTTASGYYSHAEGDSTTASANYSHAEGSSTEASNSGAHAEGYNTKASGQHAHAEGNSTTASGTNSHAGGYGTIASGSAQTVIGQYNVSNSTSRFIVGNGTSSARVNAFAIDAGNARIRGDAYIGCDVDSTGGTLLKVLKITKSSVSSLSTTITNAGITANMEVLHCVLSNPSAQTGDWTVTTSSGSAVISGNISGTTNITLYLAEPST